MNPLIDPYAVGWLKNDLDPAGPFGRTPWSLALLVVPTPFDPAKAGVAYQGVLFPGEWRCFQTAQNIGERRFALLALGDTLDPGGAERWLYRIQDILTRLSAGGDDARALADSLMAGQVALPAGVVVRHTGLFDPTVSQFGNGLEPARPIIWEWRMLDAGWTFGEVNPQPPPCTF